jgi:hypothetical protein
MVMHYIVMPANRFRPNMIHTYLHPEEDKFIKDYAKRNFLTVSELIRGWIHEAMKSEGYEINEPSLPDTSKTNKGVK